MAEETDKKHVATEELILRAAEAEFLQKGYAGARTTAIAEAAGVTHAMLHYYFRTKEQLFEKIMHEKMGLVRDIMLGSMGDTNKPLFNKVRDTVAEHIDFIAANPDLPRFMVNEVFYNPERLVYVRSLMQAHAPLLVANLQHEIDDLAARGECRKVDARMLLLDIVSLNIFSFMAAPLVNTLMGSATDDMAAFVEARKRENTDTILRKLKP